MPISIDGPIRAMTQDEFGAVAFDVMRHAFAIHNEMGRFFDEEVYQNELCRRLGDRAVTEVEIQVTLGEFRKPYRIDLLVDRGAIFEIKTASELHDQHRTQLIHYLMMTGSRHGKLMNFRPEQVDHEFINCTSTLAERQQFEVQTERWNRLQPGSDQFQDILTSCLQDWGAGLELQLYDDALVHFLGGKALVEKEIEVTSSGQRIGMHAVRMMNATTAFKLTSITRDLQGYESHLRRLMSYTQLEHVLWANMTSQQVIFVVVSRN
jgi:GxxExxY protein